MLATALVGGAIVTGGLVSHSAAAVEGRSLALGAQALHLLATALWTGGLVGFDTVFWRAASAPLVTSEARRLLVAIPVFSQLAVLSVGALILSGVVLARLHLTEWDELIGTRYGRWLTAKLVVFAAMLVLGAYHQTRGASPTARGECRNRRSSDGRALSPEHSGRGRLRMDLPRFRGHCSPWGRRSPRCRRRDPRIHRNSGRGSSSWLGPGGHPRSWAGSTSPPRRRSGTGCARPIGMTAAGLTA